MKGQLEVPLLGIIATVTIIVSIIASAKFLSMPLTQVINYEAKHDNSQLILISLLSSTKDGKTVQELIGNYIVFGKPAKNDLEQILTEKLDKMVESECYRLSTSSEVLVERLDCEPEEYEKETFIALPYNSEKLGEKLTLVIN